MHVFAEEEIFDIVSSFKDYELQKVLSRRVDSVTVVVRERSAARLLVLKVIRLGPSTEDERPILSASITKLKALEKLFSKTANIKVQESVELSLHRILYRRPYYPMTLFDRVRCQAKISKSEQKWLAFQLIKAVDEIHEKGCFHGGLSLDSIFVTEFGWLILSDFDPIQYKSTEWCASSMKWRELPFTADCFGARSFCEGREEDVFALGVLLYTIFTGRVLRREFSLESHNISNIAHEISTSLSPELSEMVIRMIGGQQGGRPDVKAVLEYCRETIFPGVFSGYLHPYFALLPITSDKCDPNAHHAALNKIAGDLDDLIFMTREAERNCELILERLFLYFLKVCRSGVEQLQIFCCMKSLSKTWNTDLVTEAIIPPILEMFPYLSSDAKKDFFDLLEFIDASKNPNLQGFIALSICEKMKQELHLSVLSRGLVFLSKTLSKSALEECENGRLLGVIEEIQTLTKFTRQAVLTYFDSPSIMEGDLDTLIMCYRCAPFIQEKRHCLNVILNHHPQHYQISSFALLEFSDNPTSKLLDLQLLITAKASECPKNFEIRFVYLALCAVLHPLPSIREAGMLFLSIRGLSEFNTLLPPVSSDYFDLTVTLESKRHFTKFCWEDISDQAINLACFRPQSDKEKADFMAPVIIADACQLVKKRNHSMEFISLDLTDD